MDGYIQNELVECNRLRSEEAESGNDENAASWTNTLSNIYELNAGDKVSLYGSFISEKGAGTQDTIELKGKTLPKTKSFTYVTENVKKEVITNRYTESVITETTEDIELKDNIVNLIIGYYKNTNGTGYFSLPRSSYGTLGLGGDPTGTAANTTVESFDFTRDDSGAEGYIYPVVDKNFIIKGDYKLSPYSNGNSIGAVYRVINDNNKFTLFVSQYSKLGIERSIGINGGLGDIPEPSDHYTMDPEYRQYYRYRQKITIEVDKGFNSAQFIADSITKKLQETQSITNLVYSTDPTKNEADNACGNTIISNMIESNTYKTFNCANRDLMNSQEFGWAGTKSETRWYNNYQCVAWKRPELYEFGQHINLNATDRIFTTYTAEENTETETNSVFVLTGDTPLTLSYDANMLISVPNNPLTPSSCIIAEIKDQDINKVQEIVIIGTTGGTIIASGDKVIIETINENEFTTESTRLLGCQLRVDYVNDETDMESLKTNILYTKENLDKFKKFINSQELYPEIWESWNAEDGADTSAFTYGNGMYNNKQTIDNTRFFHMNQVENDRAIEIDPALAPNAVSDTEVFLNYTTPATTINVDWNGDPDDLFKVGSIYYKVLLFDGSETPLFTGKINVTDSVGSATDDHQTLTLETAIDVDIPEGRNLKVELITIDNYNHYLKTHTMLGSSNYRNAFVGSGNTTVFQKMSKLFLVYYNENDRDIYYDNPDIIKNKLTYGCFGKSEVYNAVDDTYTYYIDIYPNNIDTNLTFPFDQFKNENDKIDAGRKWGYDMHFTAAANPAIGLFNGLTCSANYYGATFNNVFQCSKYGFPDNNQTANENRVATSDDIKGYINRRYVGADSPKCIWDGEHFSFDSLHTNENLAPRYADGGRYMETTIANTTSASTSKFAQLTADVPDSAGDIVYKINPLQDLNEYCPNIIPYQLPKTFYTRNGKTENEAGLQTFLPFNRCYEAFTIFDSKSGIFFEDMGYDEDTWEEGLWGIMGFSYEQFNSSINNRNKRVDNSNVNDLMVPTTNAFIQSTDTKTWNVNENSIPLYTDNIPTTFNLFTYKDDGSYETDVTPPPDIDFHNLTVYPPINQKTTSIQLVARNFPTSMIKGYYTIRSDIVPQSVFVGGKSNITNMPIVGIANKENPQSDYYFGGESNIEFTIGKPTKLSSITCSIHDPDGSYANVNNSSSIIFKIQRQINTSFNIIDEILQNENKKSNKKSNKNKL